MTKNERKARRQKTWTMIKSDRFSLLEQQDVNYWSQISKEEKLLTCFALSRRFYKEEDFIKKVSRSQWPVTIIAFDH